MLTIAAGDLLTQLRRRFGVRGPADLHLEESIIPVASMGNLDDAPWHVKGGFMGTISQAAVAVQQSYLGVQVPDNAPVGSILVLRKMWIWSSTAQLISLGFLTNAYIAATLGMAVVAGAPSWDTSEGNPGTTNVSGASPRSFSAKVTGANVTDALGQTFWPKLWVGIQSAPLVFDFPIVVRRGNAFVVEGLTVNTQLDATVIADEYVPE